MEIGKERPLTWTGKEQQGIAESSRSLLQTAIERSAAHHHHHPDRPAKPPPTQGDQSRQHER